MDVDKMLAKRELYQAWFAVLCISVNFINGIKMRTPYLVRIKYDYINFTRYIFFIRRYTCYICHSQIYWSV